MSLEELKAAIVAEVVRCDDTELLQEFAARLAKASGPVPPETELVAVIEEPEPPAAPTTAVTQATPTAPQSEDRIIGYTIDGEPEYMNETLGRWEMDYERSIKTGSLRSMEETYIAAMQTLGIDV